MIPPCPQTAIFWRELGTRTWCPPTKDSGTDECEIAVQGLPIFRFAFAEQAQTLAFVAGFQTPTHTKGGGIVKSWTSAGSNTQLIDMTTYRRTGEDVALSADGNRLFWSPLGEEIVGSQLPCPVANL